MRWRTPPVSDQTRAGALAGSVLRTEFAAGGGTSAGRLTFADGLTSYWPPVEFGLPAGLRG